MFNIKQAIYTSDMQDLVWGEPELTQEYDFDVENIIIAGSLKYATWRNGS